jgi:formylmethanofuran dehydrogenase subunit B
MEPNSSTVFDNVACTGCGCVCDDLRVTVSNGRIVRADRACAMAERWLLAQDAAADPRAEANGRPASLEAAIQRSANVLRLARNPLVYGLSQSTTAGQQAAIALAEHVGGIVDTTASLCHAPSVMAQQEVGKVTCTLGEVRNRADLVIFWGSDPVNTHPRHWERYSVDPTGRFVPRGRADRLVVVADDVRTDSANAADFFLPIAVGQHFDTLFTLHALNRGVIANAGDHAGAPAPLLAELSRRMKSARCGVIFFGVELARGDAGHCNVQALLKLVTDLNAYGRWFAMRMRVQGNVVGADTVLTWQTGYPFSVSMARGYPRYNPGEFSVQQLLQRNEVDACVLVGSATLDWMAPDALDHLRRIPTIVLDPPEIVPMISPTVRFRTARPGIHIQGTAYRMDGVPIPLRAVLPAPFPSDAEVLGRIQRTL